MLVPPPASRQPGTSQVFSPGNQSDGAETTSILCSTPSVAPMPSVHRGPLCLPRGPSRSLAGRESEADKCSSVNE